MDVRCTFLSKERRSLLSLARSVLGLRVTEGEVDPQEEVAYDTHADAAIRQQHSSVGGHRVAQSRLNHCSTCKDHLITDGYKLHIFIQRKVTFVPGPVRSWTLSDRR